MLGWSEGGGGPGVQPCLHAFTLLLGEGGGGICSRTGKV